MYLVHGMPILESIRGSGHFLSHNSSVFLMATKDNLLSTRLVLMTSDFLIAEDWYIETTNCSASVEFSNK